MSYMFSLEKKKRKTIMAWILIVVGCIAVAGVFGGCVTNLNMKGKKEKVDYVICKDSGLPKQLKELLEEKKKKPGTFAFKNSMYTYLIVCYGSQTYSGYSIKVEDCFQTKEALYLRTQLIGPSGSDPVLEAETFPYIVIRCKRTDAICIIDS